MSLSDEIQIDDANDMLTVNGVKMSGALLRALTEPTAAGVWFRVVEKHGDHVHLEQRMLDTVQ